MPSCPGIFIQFEQLVRVVIKLPCQELYVPIKSSLKSLFSILRSLRPVKCYLYGRCLSRFTILVPLLWTPSRALKSCDIQGPTACMPCSKCGLTYEEYKINSFFSKADWSNVTSSIQSADIALLDAFRQYAVGLRLFVTYMPRGQSPFQLNLHLRLFEHQCFPLLCSLCCCLMIHNAWLYTSEDWILEAWPKPDWILEAYLDYPYKSFKSDCNCSASWGVAITLYIFALLANSLIWLSTNVCNY